MKFVKLMIIVAMFGLATGFLPKTSSAADVSVGLSFGIPFPAVVVYPAAPPPPPVVVYSPPPPPAAAYYPAYYQRRPYHRHAYANGPYSKHYRGHGYRVKGHGY
ncbi:MAG: hypothetical protein A4E74_01265 [Syntrophus sp. PtaB.Bin075]|nr:MAG: hypothetical protein A4E74_01265 [Syntrophus sp. PtaB.Bin075]